MANYILTELPEEYPKNSSSFVSNVEKKGFSLGMQRIWE